MKRFLTRKYLLPGCGVFVFGLFLAMAWPIFVFWHRPRVVAFNVGTIYAVNVNGIGISRLEKSSDSLVVLEGPCSDNSVCSNNDCGCHGGILGAKDVAANKEALPPGLKGYDAAASSIVWVYGVKPVRVRRRNDAFGDDEVTIEGQQEKNRAIYLTLVPKPLVAGHLMWVSVELPPQDQNGASGKH